MTEGGFDSWHEALRRRRALDKPWLMLPKAPSLSAECRSISYGDLFEYAVRAANAMHQRVGASSRVVLVAENSAECCISIFAALLAGLTLVPTAPRALGRPHNAWKRDVERLVRDCEPVLLIGSESDLQALDLGPAVIAASFDELLGGDIRGGLNLEALSDPGRTALWQYTSGTTGGARAVELSHFNVLQNVSGIGQRVDASERDVGATWLPLFHDMGLIGSLLFSTYWGMPLVLMTPRTFVARPQAWLWAISRFKVTCSAAPNSAYEICASKIKAPLLRGLNLSSWRLAFNGAELVHAATVQRFCSRFGEYGFRAEAMYPVYGLAEHTVAATLPPLLGGARSDWIDAEHLERCGRAIPAVPEVRGARPVVAVGTPLSGHELRLVTADGVVVSEERVVGEIQLRGPSRMQRYRAEGQALATGEWLRTGDLGYLVNGSLYAVGRSSHRIKHGGRLIDAALIEGAARVVEGVRSGVVAAFGVPDANTGTERIVVLVEAVPLTADEMERMRREIIRTVVDAASVAPDFIQIVLPGSIPRTTSGKVRHSAARERYLGVLGATP